MTYQAEFVCRDGALWQARKDTALNISRVIWTTFWATFCTMTSEVVRVGDCPTTIDHGLNFAKRPYSDRGATSMETPQNPHVRERAKNLALDIGGNRPAIAPNVRWATLQRLCCRVPRNVYALKTFRMAKCGREKAISESEHH